MHPKPSRHVPVHPDVIPFEAPAGDLNRVGCVECRRPLELHQPDPQSPDRLLGICTGCGRWYVMVLAAGQSQGVWVVLPDRQWFQAVAEAHHLAIKADQPRIEEASGESGEPT